MATAAKQTRSRRTVSASFTIRPEQPTGAGPGNLAGFTAVERPQCYRPTRRIILSGIPRKSLRSWLTRSIGLAEANWTRVSPIPWPTSQASFCARWNRVQWRNGGIDQVRALRIAMLFMAAAIAFGPVLLAQSWERSKGENPLYGKTYDQFILNGRYLTPPSTVGSETPRLVVHCGAGKFASGEFMLGAVAQHSGTKSLKGAWQSQVDMRLDERKKTEDFWEYSNDGKTLFFDRDQLDRLLTGKLLGHPSKDELTKRVILGVTEALGNEVIVQFDMPADQSEIIEACGLEWGRKKPK